MKFLMHLTLRRFLFYALGIFVLTFGIAMTIQSNMGTGPFDALLVGLFKSFGLTIGSREIVVGLLMVLLNALVEKRKPEYLALLTSFITGVCIDFWLFVISHWIHPDKVIGEIFCLVLGLIIGGLGIALNLQADFAPNPMDRSMLVLKKLTGLNIAISRALISILLVILAFVFHGPIAVGTILSALFTGTIIKFFIPYVSKLDNKRTKTSERLSM
jgi:uncharacterized protein